MTDDRSFDWTRNRPGGPARLFATLALLVCLSILSAASGARAAASSQTDASDARPLITIASKVHTESVVLAEAARLLLEDAGFEVRHRAELGGSQVVFKALENGDINLYPDYTGTLQHEIFAGQAPGIAALRQRLAERGLAMGPPLGFDNTYAIAMRAGHAQRLGIETLADLAQHPDLALGFSNEFLDRGDGWRGMAKRYDLPHRNVQGMQHDLAYRAIASGRIDVTDAYATDAEIVAYDLAVLRDNRRYFPGYEGAYIYDQDLDPRAVRALNRLAGAIDADTMRRANALVKLEGRPDGVAAAKLLGETGTLDVDVASGPGLAERLWGYTLAHLALVAVSLGLALVIAVPLGIAAARLPRLGHVVLGTVGVLQTIPSLALLVVLIPLLGIGWAPTVAMLFVYSLLPLVRNTHAGLTGIPLSLQHAAQALGLPARAKLWRIELPLALPTILAGVKTAAVINVGTATLGALVGAGGYGQPILTGIRLNDQSLILEGAIPSAVLALLVVVVFEGVERALVAPPLRGKTGR
ncbi:glycine betaine ABC transporter substrate-binding protein [Rhodothalassium salexigens]|uniref:glycine betaine ABC transporter substrate-binding protein n=1 Tax=Rhodothalassium salexigens TaxID=1086 RepID=UPI001911BA3C|nr:glycine betaine ABC transporter substrate-binding protein [Rhodothalassium salexigens]